MSHRITDWLEDILERINRINIVLGPHKNFFKYEENWQQQDIVERCLEVIGEAMKRILDKEPDINISYARKVVNLRNLVIHTYDKIEPEAIWQIVTRDLPLLKTEVEALLEERKE